MANSKTSLPRPLEVSRREFLQRSATAAAIPALPRAVGGEGESPEGHPKRPNVIIIHADQMRWDTVGAYGLNPMGLTPNLDAMA